MRTTLLATAIFAACASLAHAESNLQVYGSFDAGLRDATNVNSNGNSRVTMGSNGTYNSNRLGFKGIEDLGGGLNAHFTLELGFNTGTGSLNNTAGRFFERSAFVGLGGRWGALDLGRQFTVAYKTVGPYDPFDFKYSGIIPTSQASVAAGTRVDNDIQYTGTFGPVTARAEWALGEQAGSARNGSQQALGLSYANGPILLGGAYTLRKPAVGAAGATGTAGAAGVSNQNNRHWTVGGGYTFGPAKVAIGYARETQDLAAGNDISQKNAWVGGNYGITPALTLAAAYYDTRVDSIGGGNRNGKRQLLIVGATYKLSKRTNFYADVDYARYKDGLSGTLPANVTNGQLPGIAGAGVQLPIASPAGQSRQLAFSVGVNHLF